ncbi:uronate isomerase [Buttiauxella brennerae ATCC 51605]|uniref:Uronate isomerase n=1 Tax=Buttiauxella brennerae ATCC 51605 TaxID=1354251 RepID=A0A1B7IQ35_9ENTR|nr:glucuronate isomerase [Buttiauxella brennerae]OAT31854.1 uronate isomerase [Buttiauxella brennerae ATCC 51605]
MTFINDHFMINNEQGRKLYCEVAKSLPIIDYHCHLNAKEIYENKSFENINHLWLSGDHYKWRAMRANGISEEKITGSATHEEKFHAWAETVELSIGNPLYHWTHLELQYYFGIEEVLGSHNWRKVMNICNESLLQKEFTPRSLISRSNVEVICTTDSPLDSLEYHQLLQQDSNFTTKVLPTFRPDEIFDEDAQSFTAFIDKLSELTSVEVKSLFDFNLAIGKRIDFFHEVGCRISDHGPIEITYQAATEQELEVIFIKNLNGEQTSKAEQNILNSAIFLMLARHYKARNWAMQLHFGAIRNNNSVMKSKLGINVGFDSISDQCNLASGLNGLLDAMAKIGALPKTIVYNLNASYNDIVATTIANFQSGEAGVKSPIQFGSGWWFNDTRRGMENQLICLAEQGLLANFIGMLTDSRSFISYTRHDYFRRILCNIIGKWVADGDIPDNKELLSTIITNICHENASKYFGF